MPLTACLVLALSRQSSAADLNRYVYRLAPAMKCPPVELDVTDFPQSRAWGEAAQALVRSWYGKLTELLATDGRDPLTGEKQGRAYKSPKVLRIVIKHDLEVPAETANGTITVNGKWITAHPDDLGMMIHELTHVIQDYPDSPTTPGWLVEGIADYIRWWRYEPELHATRGRTKIDFSKANYTDAYRTTAKWLAWASRTYDMRLVPCLDKAMKDKQDPLPLFKKLTGKTPDELWSEFSQVP